MALETTTITGLPNATTPLAGTERVPVDQGGATKDASTQDIADLANTAIEAAVNAHVEEENPHPQYLTQDDIGDQFDPTGTADAAIAAHIAEEDPHGQYAQTAADLDLGASDAPTFAGLTITGTGAVSIPHIHGSIAGNFYVHVRNTSGAPLAAGTAVYATGSVGDTDRITVAACDPTDSAKMPAIGILETTLANNGNGDAVILGELRPLNTADFGINQHLYVGPSGALTGTRPTSGIVQAVGTVARVQSETGTVVVQVGDRLGTAAATDTTDYATAAQGVLADSAVQPDNAALSDARTPTAHKTTHATGGTDALTPGDIGAEVAGAAAAAQSAAISAAAADADAKASAAQAAAIAASAPAAQGVTNGNGHDHSGGDGAQIAYSSLSGLPSLGTAAAANIGTTAGTVPVLDGAGLVPSALLPGFVDDVLEFANLAAFPVTGEAGKLYISLATNRQYRWGGSVYVEINPSPGSTDGVPEGSVNLYFTSGRGEFAAATWWAASSAKTKLDGIENGAQVNVATDISYDSATREVRSSTGSDAVLPLVTTSAAGLASANDKQKLDIAVVSNTTGITGADAVTNIVSLTQAEYDAIASPGASVLYVIVS